MLRLPGRSDAYDAAGETYCNGLTVLSQREKATVKNVAKERKITVISLFMSLGVWKNGNGGHGIPIPPYPNIVTYFNTSLSRTQVS
jgi:hypothetical protein